jgi:diguanylate cyclase (GGDEF)-like protein
MTDQPGQAAYCGRPVLTPLRPATGACDDRSLYMLVVTDPPQRRLPLFAVVGDTVRSRSREKNRCATMSFAVVQRRPWRAPLLLAGTITAATGVVLPHESLAVGPHIGFVPALLAVIATLDLLSAYLLLTQFRDTGEVRVLAMSCAYTFSLVVMLGYGGAFPNVVAPVGPFATAPSVAPWLYVTWHAGFPIFLGLAWMPWPRWVPRQCERQLRAAAARTTQLACLLGASLLVWCVVRNGSALPVLIRGLDTSRMTQLTAPIALPLVLASAVVTAWTLRHRTGPERWTVVAVWACLLDLVLTYSSRSRFSLGWYSGRTMSVTAAAVVFVAMLGEMSKLKQQLLVSEGNLAAVAKVVRRIRTGEDARVTVVGAALPLADASVALLVERDPTGALLITAAAGMEVAGTALPLNETSASAEVFRTGQPMFVADLAADKVANQAVVGLLGACSALWQPIIIRGDVVGVLAVTWSHRIVGLSDQAVQAVSLLADEAAVALQHDQLLAQYAELAATDALTGLANRRFWDGQIPRYLSEARRYQRPLTLAVLDLDHFKAYNDEHGHLQGDVFLQCFADAAREEVREVDLLARWGGEEFALALTGCDEPAALVVLNRIRQSVPQGQTVSIGYATWDGEESFGSLMGRADTALYGAKASGRDQALAAQIPAARTAPRAVETTFRAGA